jgi:hypothetical protein
VHREGTCTEGGTKIAVVDRHGVLKLESLEARLLAVDEHKTIRGRLGSKTATSVSIFEPEALFSESEYGVIRTYR